MAISWKETQVINTPLSQEVIKQLGIRREIFSKENNITDQELKFLHSNTGWIKVSSGVDEILNEDGTINPQVNKSAKENILFGGVFNSDTGIKNGILSENSSYSFSEQYGYRPMAGITSFNITNLDTYGAVRKATIDFSVNSLEDLSTFERLYLRPGFTAMIEFGHTILAKSPEKNGPYYIDTNIDFYDNFFDNIEVEGPEIKQKQDESDEEFKDRKIQIRNNSRLKKVELEIKRLRNESGYNYDAMFGRISNFQWTYNTDTTYDCSFDVMGYGSVIESLSALSSENIAGGEDDPSDGKTSIGNKFAKILDFAIEADPFIIVSKDSDESEDENPNDTKTDPNKKPERNAKIAAVIHYACEGEETSPVYSDIEDSEKVREEFEEQTYLQEGDVFEFVGGAIDPRYDKAVRKAYVVGDNDGANFVVVKVYKGNQSVLGYIRTQFGLETGQVLRDQPTQYNRFTFVPERIVRDEGKTIRYLKRIVILPESQEFLNETYSELVNITEKQKTTNNSTTTEDTSTRNTTTENTEDISRQFTTEDTTTENTTTEDTTTEDTTTSETQSFPPPFYNQPTPEEKLNVKRRMLLGNDEVYGGYKKTSVKYSKNPLIENYSKPIPEPNGKFKGKLSIAFLNTETAEVYYRTTNNKGKLK